MTSDNDKSDNADIPTKRRRQRRTSDSAVGQRIFERLEDRTQAWLSAKSGVSEKTLSDYVSTGIPTTSAAIKIADALGVTLDWLMRGPQAERGSIASVFPTDQLEIAQGKIRIASRPDLDLLDAQEDLDLVEVQEIDLAYGLGGTFSEDAVEVRMMQFPRAWIEQITRTPAAQLTFARGRGDSMMPTITDGDMVLIDRSQRSVREQDAIWAMTVGEIAMIKRIRSRGERVLILSDNDRIPADDVFHEELNVVGRVIFIGRKV